MPAASPRSFVPGCGGSVALGSTSTCDFPAGGGTARYRVTVAAADTIRMRAAVPTGVTPMVTVRAADGTSLCTQFTRSQGQCEVPSAGLYLVDVELDRSDTAYTTIDSARTPGSCAASPNLSVGTAGVPISLTDGASWCASLAAVGGDVLEAVLDENADHLLDVRVYDDTGAPQCSMAVSAFGRSQCTPVAGTGLRMFATFSEDVAQNTTLILARVSHPAGCRTGVPDTFGSAPTRRATLRAHQQRCYRFTAGAGAGDRVGMHLLALGGSSSTLTWRIRDDDGQVMCAGTPGATVSPCTLPAGGWYTLFVSTLGRSVVRYVAALTDLRAGTGCTPLAGTAWGQAPTAGSLGVGQVNCHTFTAAPGHQVRLTVFDNQAHVTAALVVDSAGASVCSSFTGRLDCNLTGAGPYRVLESASALAPADYRLWITDLDSTDGCSPTDLDAMGSGPTRTGELTADTIAVCWTFHAAQLSAYLSRALTVSGAVFPRWEIRGVDSPTACISYADLPGNCRIDVAGTYLLVVTPNFGSEDPTQIGTVRVGLWRIDRPSDCPVLVTAFGRPAVVGSIATPLEADCHRFTGSPNDLVFVRADSDHPGITTMIFDAEGNRICFGPGTCRLTGPGAYRLITFALGSTTTPYRLRVASLTSQRGCRMLRPSTFGRGPTRAFALDGAADIACYRLDRAASFGQLAVRTVAADPTAPGSRARVSLYRPDGNQICSDTVELLACTAAGAGPFLAVVVAPNAAEGILGWADLTATEGCATAPSLAFGSAPVPGRIARRGAIGCTTVPLAPREQVRLAFADPAGVAPAELHGWLVDGYGRRLCEFGSASPGWHVDCRPAGNTVGPYRVLVWADEDAGVFTAKYALHAWRLTKPSGCTRLPLPVDGFGPLVGTLADSTDQACYQVRVASGDIFQLATSNDDVPANVPQVQFVQPNGTVACSAQGTGHSCSTPTGGRWAVIVLRGTGAPDVVGHYRVSAVCTNPACGPG